MRRAVLVLLISACACASPPPTAPAQTPAGEPADTEVQQLLARSEFRFQDPDTLADHRAYAPFELIGADGGKLLFKASGGIGEPEVRITILDREGQLWAHFRFANREFLTLLQ